MFVQCLPTSDPIPRGVDPAPIKQPSPPEDPPAVRPDQSINYALNLKSLINHFNLKCNLFENGTVDV